MTTSILSVRLNEDERQLLEAASDQAKTNLSDFVRRKAVEAAEVEILDRRVVTIPAIEWEKFESWAKRPARNIKGLRDLAKRRTTWQR